MFPALALVRGCWSHNRTIIRIIGTILSHQNNEPIITSLSSPIEEHTETEMEKEQKNQKNQRLIGMA